MTERPLVLIVDDHDAVRKVIRSLIEESHFLQVCGEARNGKEAVERVRWLKPDIVLLDISMPVMDGFDAARRIAVTSPQTKIVFLTMFDSPTIRHDARRVSDGFVSKASAGLVLIPTLTSLVQMQALQREAPVKLGGQQSEIWLRNTYSSGTATMVQ